MILIEEIEVIIQCIQNALYIYVGVISSEPIPLGYCIPQEFPVQVQDPRQVTYRIYTLKRMRGRFIIWQGRGLVLRAEAGLLCLYRGFSRVQVRTGGFTSPFTQGGAIVDLLHPDIVQQDRQTEEDQYNAG